jgi:hypothetical protein
MTEHHSKNNIIYDLSQSSELIMIPLLPQKILFARIDKAEHVFLLQKEYV